MKNLKISLIIFLLNTSFVLAEENSFIKMASFTYENDSVFSRYERVWGDGQSRLNITTSDLLSVKNISGFIYLKETKETPLTYLFIEEPLLFRFKAKQKDVSNIVQEEDSVIKTRQNDSLMEIPAKVENGIIVRKRSTHRPISRQ